MHGFKINLEYFDNNENKNKTLKTNNIPKLIGNKKKIIQINLEV